MSDEKPISDDDLRGLFEYLDSTSMTGYQCDHKFTLTRQYLGQRQLPAEPILQWLGENGAGCDCEIMFNVAQEWEEAVGYVAPDADDDGNCEPSGEAEKKPWWQFW